MTPILFQAAPLDDGDRTYRQLVPEISHDLATRDLNELVKAGLLAAQGEKRGRRYLPTPDMHTVAMAVRAEVSSRYPGSGDPYE